MGSVPRVHFQSGSNPLRNFRINESTQLSDHLHKTPTGIENGHKVHQIKPILRIKETNSDKKGSQDINKGYGTYLMRPQTLTFGGQIFRCEKVVRADKKPKTATGCLKAKGSYKNDFQEDLKNRNPEDSGELRSFKKVQIIEDMDSKVCTIP